MFVIFSFKETADLRARRIFEILDVNNDGKKISWNIKKHHNIKKIDPNARKAWLVGFCLSLPHCSCVWAHGNIPEYLGMLWRHIHSQKCCTSQISASAFLTILLKTLKILLIFSNTDYADCTIFTYFSQTLGLSFLSNLVTIVSKKKNWLAFFSQKNGLLFPLYHIRRAQHGGVCGRVSQVRL